MTRTYDAAPGPQGAPAWGRRAEDQPSRLVVDPATRRRWNVRLRRWDRSPADPRSECLTCDCGDVIRRVWPVPDGWRRMPDAALLALMERPPASH